MILPRNEPTVQRVDVVDVQADDRAILFSYGHRPDRCVRCMNALATLTDHSEPVSMEKMRAR